LFETGRILPKSVNSDFRMDELSEDDRGVYRKLNQLKKKVTEDIEQFKFNTAIAAQMEFMNSYTQVLGESGRGVTPDLQSFVLHEFNIILAPFAPHLSEELYEMLGGKPSIFSSAKWVKYDPGAIEEESATMVVQVNGKVRAKLTVPVNSTDDAVKSSALNDENVKRHLEGKQIVKAIVVPNKIINFVVR
ncbi:MAG: hypothetical protein B7Z63_02255, partial [Ignavibacteriae bacterium 37-53-5]